MMKAFSFLTILESLSKKLSILRTKMHSDDLRVNHGTITRVLRVSRPFSHYASSGASFALSRRVSHFAAMIFAVLFTIGVGSVSAQGVSMYDLFGYGINATGGRDAKPILVDTESELRAALKKNSVVIITEDITVEEQIKITDNFSNVTLMALPGKKLISNVKQQENSGILYLKGSNIIIRNVTFVGPGAMDCDGEDLLGFDGVTNAWVDHCDFQDGLDGNFDIKGESDNITISWCRFHYLKAPTPVNQNNKSDDHRYTNLLGSNADDKPSDNTYNITYAYNWWDEGCVERMVRCRNASLHFLNCYWNTNGTASYYIGPENADCYIEGCYFTEITNDHVFHQNFGSSPQNGVTYVNSYYGNGTNNRTEEVLENITNRTVTPPSYSYPTAKSYTEAQTQITSSCGAGATLLVTENGDVQQCYSNVQQFTVIFNLNGKGDSFTSTIYEGLTIPAPTTPTKIGYTFEGWYTNPECTNAYDFSTEVTSDITLYAKWTENNYCYEFTPATSGSTLDVGSTIGGEGFGGTMTVASIKEAKESISYDANGLKFSGGSNDQVLVKLENNMQAGTIITLNLVSGGSSKRGLNLLTENGTKVSELTWTPDASGEQKEFSYTVKDSDGLEGTNSFKLQRNNSTIYLKYIAVDNCAGSETPDPEPDPEPEPDPDQPGTGGGDDEGVIKIGISDNTSYASTFTSSSTNENITANATAFTMGSKLSASSSAYDKATAPYSLKYKPSSKISTDSYNDSYSVSAQFTVKTGYVFKPTAISATIVAEATSYTYQAILTDGTTTYASNEITTSASNQKITFAFPNFTGNGLSGNVTFKIWFKSTANNTKFFVVNLPIIISGNVLPSGGSAPTYTLTNAVNTDGYGTVSPTSVSGIPSGTATNSSSNTYTVNGTTVTATPTANTAQYTYAFSNWSGLPATVTGNATVTANFTRTANKYTLTWNLAGGKVTVAGTGAAVNATGTPNSEVAFGTAIIAPTVTKTGYNFSAWSSSVAATMPANDVTYTAQWTAKTTNVTLNANGGTGGTASVTATYGSAMPAITLPTRTGYTFAGYWDGENGTGNQYYKADGTSNKNWDKEAATATLYAQWTCETPVFDIKIKNDNPVVFSGESIELTVVGSNIAVDATYKWYKGTDEIAGQTANKLTIAEATANDAGNYKCVVTNGTCSGENNYTVKMYHIKGLTDGTWATPFEFVKSGDKEGTFTIELAATTTYYFKLNDGSAWYWNVGTMTHNSCTDWVIEQEGADTQGKANTGITTTASGTYTFTLNYTDPSRPTLSVTYPQKKMVYLNPGEWNCAKYAVYSWDGEGNSTVLMTKIDDCADRNIYYAEINAAHSNVIFIGGNASYDVATPWVNVLCQTIDLTYPSDENVLYEINTTHLFLTPNANWKVDGARFAAYFFDNGEEWVSMTKVTDDLYKVAIPTTKTYPSVIFCRMNPSAAANNWGNKWNQSSDLPMPTDGNNHYTVYEGAWDNGEGSWGKVKIGEWTALTPNYTVTFDANGHGTAPADQCVAEGGKVTTPTAPTATGYTFGGWYTDQACDNPWDFANGVVTSDIILYAKWTVNSYTVTWNPDGGNWGGNTDNIVQTYEYGAKINAPEKPSRTGYDFAEWDPTYDANETTMPAENVTYTAKWNIISYTITFKNGETVLQTSTIEYGATPEYTGETPTKAEDAQYTYTFSGWNPAITAVTGNATYTATFAQTAKTYTLTYNCDGATSGCPSNATEQTALPNSLPSNITKTNFVFEGWYTDEAKTIPAVAGAALTGNTTLYAKWADMDIINEDVCWNISDDAFKDLGTIATRTEVNNLHIVGASDASFVIDNNSGSETKIDRFSFDHRLKYGGKGNPFARHLWFSVKGDCDITIYMMSGNGNETRHLDVATGTFNNVVKTFDASPTASKNTYNYTGGPTTIYLYPKDNGVNIYQICVEYPVPTYTVTYETNGGSAVARGTELTALPNPLPTTTRTGYTFKGWYTDAEFNTLAVAGAALSADITLYAQWTENAPVGTVYTVTFNANGGSAVSPITQASAGAAINLPTPTKDGYEFVGWYIGGGLVTADTYTPTANITADAAWKAECTATGGGGSTTLFSTDFTESGWSSLNNTETAQTLTIGGHSVYVRANATQNLLSVNTSTGTLTWGGRNFSNKDCYLAIPVAGVNGSLTITVGNGSSTTRFGYAVVEGSVIANPSSNTNSSSANPSVCTVEDLDGTSYVVFIGRQGSNYKQATSISITTPGGGSGTCYYVTYNGNGADGGYVNDANAYAANEEVTTLPNGFTRAGYTFNGWNTAANGSGASYAAGATFTINSDTELFAQWTENTPVTPEGSYTLTYNENKPAVWEDVFAVKNIPAAQTLPNGTGNVYNGTPPVITDYANYAIYYFAGWNTAADGTGTSYAAGASISISANTTLYAQWTPRTFDVKYFDTNRTTPLEGMVNTTYTFGVGIPTLPTPTKPGHTFTGWILFWDGGQSEGTVTEIEPTTWGDAQLAAQWEKNCNMPTTTFANTRYTIGYAALNLSDFIANNNSGGAITYAVTGGVAATINGSSFTCDRIGVVTVTATQAANGGYCEKIMTATINVAMPVQGGCAQMFTFDANDEIANPSGQKGKKYLDLSSYATINGLSTTGKVGIKDMETSDNESTTLIKNSEIHFPNTNTYLKVENLSTPLAAGDKISIGTQQSATTEYIITISGTQCKSNCITTTNQQYTIPAESSLIGVTTFYVWAKTEQTHLNTINICRPAYKITYNANNGTQEAEERDDAVLVAGCPNTFTVPAGKQFAGWNTDENGSGTSYSVGTIIPENGLELYAQWECIEPVFTVSCDKTAYAKDEVNAKPISVSVTAGNSGGVTYQWYSSTTNDRTTGTAITGAIAASYTPSTATAGTTYYWCEISNSCTTVKTPTIAITVTVTKNNPTVTWTNPTGVNYGGGGYSISATVNNEWNGTLLPSMLTAPTGINLYDIEISGKTITAKFDVTTTFDRTADKIPFDLTLPETTTYNPLVSEKEVKYDACDNGGGTEYRIPVKEKSDQQDINPYNRWDTENVGWITWDQGGGTISSESATYNNFSYRTKSGKQVILIYSKIQEVKTIRIYGYGSNATQCTAVSVGKEYNKYTKLSASEYAFNGNTINNRENGVIEISFTTPLKEGTYVQFNFSKNALFYGVELETEGGEEIATTLSFATAGPIEKQQNDANFTNKATPSNNTLGTITYSSSNTDVATVNSTTGEVSIIDAGTTTITATLAPSGCYTGATATYALTVTEQTCTIAAGTLSASKTDKYDCEAVTLTLSNYEQGATIEWWHNGEAIDSKDGITINGNTLTTTLDGTYSVLVTKGCSVRSNSVTITNVASASATPLVSEWYIKSGRLTPPIALWKLEGGARIAGVVWWRGEEESTAPYDDPKAAIIVENGIVYLTGTPPQANETGEDIRYTIQLTIKNSCDDSPMVVPSTITIVHQKNTDKHVLAFVVTGKEKGGFTEEITTAQTTNVPLYNEISQEFDVLATNIYATDNEQLLKEYYSRFDIICITDYPDSKKTGVNGKSYTNAMGALIDIRPILSMEAWVSKYSNWNDKGITGDPKSPTTRQYSMLLQCKDHEIFTGTNLIQVGSGDELMYRVTMVDKNQEQYKTLDDTYGATTPHAEKATTKIDDVETITGYGYGSNPALQGFTYTSSMSSMLPIGIIDDGDGNNLQVGLERQYEIEARMIVLGVNSYAMERLTDDGERVIVNTLKYLMKKQSSEIADCSIYFDNNNGKGDNQWNNPANWAPSRNSLPQASQEARILAPCIVSDVVAKVASIKIVPDGKYAPAYNGGIDAKGSLTIAPDGALVVGGHIQAATAPNYYEARPTTPENLIVQADATGSGALIHGEENGELGATVELVSKAYSVKELNEQTGKYKKKKYWQYVALPVREALAEDAFWGAYTYQYDEAKGWIKKGTGERIEEFWGVGLSIDNEVYSGANNNEALTKFTIKGNLALAIDRDIDLTKTPDAGEGQNMIGNSWTAPIHLTSMTAEDFENATATVYIYNTGRDEQASGSIGTASSADGSTQAGQWISIPVAASALDPWQGPKVIPAMQAFEVDLEEGESGILHLNYDKHVRRIATPEEENLPLRAPKYPSDRPSMIRLRVADSTTYTDLYLIEGDQFTDEFDNAWDGKYQPCDGRSATLYAMSPIGDMAVLAQPSVNNTSVVFEPGKKSEYVFTFGYNGDITYYLNDMQLKTSTEIKEGNEYRFTYNKGDMKNRFLVTRESFDSPNISTGLANIVTDGNGLQVTNPNQENLQVILIDAAGRLCSIYNTAEPMFNIELPATQGVYMINVKGETTNIVRKVVK